MSNASTPSSPARPSPIQEDSPLVNAAREPQHGVGDGDDGEEGHGRDEDAEECEAPQRRQRLHRGGLAKKLKFMTQLLKNLDALVYAELSALYYMECSFFRFCIRCFAQFTFLTPKSDSFPLIMPASRTHVVSIFLPNAICILLHLFSSLPTATDESRGYLHGGIMVDFIGQKAPTSMIPLLFLDMAILVLQCLMLAVHSQREKLRGVLQSRHLSNATDVDEAGQGSSTAEALGPSSGTQDHDAEERGVLRDDPEPTVDDDIELRPLGPSARSGQAGDRGERNPLLKEFSSRTSVRRHLSEVMSSDYNNAAAHSIQTLGYTAAIAALTARRRAEAAGGTR